MACQLASPGVSWVCWLPVELRQGDVPAAQHLFAVLGVGYGLGVVNGGLRQGEKVVGLGHGLSPSPVVWRSGLRSTPELRPRSTLSRDQTI